jgi:hypothetical protein
LLLLPLQSLAVLRSLGAMLAYHTIPLVQALHTQLLLLLLPLQSLAVLRSLGAMLARHFKYVAGVHVLCLHGNVTTKRRQQTITSFNTSPECKVCPLTICVLSGISRLACALCSALVYLPCCACVCQSARCAAGMACYAMCYLQVQVIGMHQSGSTW